MALLRRPTPWLALVTFYAFFSTSSMVLAVDQQKNNEGEKVSYQKGDLVPVSCLNRTIETGEHMTDSKGNLQYIPFPICAETNAPLAFPFLQSAHQQNCTITLTDPLFHLMEFYIHNDAPMTCRVPAFRLPGTVNINDHDSNHKRKASGSDPSSSFSSDALSGANMQGVLGRESDQYIPLIIALSGTLQLSHVHVANELNVLIHTGGGSVDSSSLSSSSSSSLARSSSLGGAGHIESAAAYSLAPRSRNVRIVIGDELRFVMGVRWYEGAKLPHGRWGEQGTDFGGRGVTGGGGWLGPWLVGFAVGFAVCLAYLSKAGFRLPKSLERGWLSVNGLVGWKSSELPKYNGYGYGIGPRPEANGFTGTGKRD